MLVTKWAAEKAANSAGLAGFIGGILAVAAPALFAVVKLASNLDARGGRVIDLEHKLEEALGRAERAEEKLQRELDRDSGSLLHLAAERAVAEEEDRDRQAREVRVFHRLKKAVEEKDQGNSNSARA
jgi:hypothetical protein